MANKTGLTLSDALLQIRACEADCSDADAAFSAQLEADHGKRAAEFRYYPNKQTAEARFLCNRYLAACVKRHAAWEAYYQLNRVPG